MFLVIAVFVRMLNYKSKTDLCLQDPDAKKPEDWDDREKIDDPDDTKPEDWEQPEHIPDPDAEKPEDWDDEMDGEWEPPMIDNPDYKVKMLHKTCLLFGRYYDSDIKYIVNVN